MSYDRNEIAIRNAYRKEALKSIPEGYYELSNLETLLIEEDLIWNRTTKSFKEFDYQDKFYEGLKVLNFFCVVRKRKSKGESK